MKTTLKAMLLPPAIWLLAVIFSTLSTAASAEERERENPFGVIDRLDLSNSALIVDDTYFKLALNVKIYNLEGKTISRYQLRKGQKIKYQWAPIDRRKLQLTNIWILPDTAQRSIERR